MRRPDPRAFMRTYSIVRPLDTHTRAATCAEVECDAWRNGWVTRLDIATALGRQQAQYVTARSGRHFTTNRLPGGIVEYTFPPGQECFAAHRVTLEREPLYLVRQGAHGRFAGARTHDTAAHWVEDCATNQDRLAKLIGG